jgi:hypothetical protein
MYKIILYVLMIVIVLGSLGCIKDDSITAEVFNPVQTNVNRLVTEEATWNDYGKKITTLEQRAIPPVADFGPTNTEIKKIQDRLDKNDKDIKDLQDTIALMKKVTGPTYATPSNPVPSLGSNNWQYGTYQVFSTGQSTGDVNHIYFNGYMQSWQVNITNTTAGPLYVYPMIIFNTNQGTPLVSWNPVKTANAYTANGPIQGIYVTSSNSNNLVLNISPQITALDTSTSWSISGNTIRVGTVDYTPRTDNTTAYAVNTNTLTITPTSGGVANGGTFCGAGTTVVFYINVMVYTLQGTSSGPWTMNITPIGWWNQ